MRLASKIAVITAAAAGIGRATALAFAREGATVWATDVDGKGLASLEGLNTAILDVRSDDEVAAFFAKLGRCDVLINAAGMVPNGTVLDNPPETFRTAFDLNVLSMVRTIRAVLPGMLERGEGSIVNIASVASSIKGVANRAAYGTTKAAVIGLTKSVAADTVMKGVRCNAVCPATVDTPSLRARIAAEADPEAALKAFISRQPMGRFGTADEIAAGCVYLASDESRFTTGSTLIIDGGWG